MSEGDLALAVETKLRQLLPAVQSAVAEGRLESPTLRDAADRLRDTAAALAELYRNRLMAVPNSKLVALLKKRALPTPIPTANLLQVTYGATTLAQLRAAYRTQLQAEAVAAAGLIADDPAVRGLWMYWGDWEDHGVEGAQALPFFRAEALAAVLSDLTKYSALLARSEQPIALRAGAEVFRDDFQALRSEWQGFGAPQMRVVEGNLEVSGEACTVWLAQELENAVIAFDYTPLRLSAKAGALFAFPGRPLPGYDWQDAAGAMDLYNTRIETYHASLCRGSSGMTNLRRTGTGLRMLSTVTPDPCAELGRKYRVELIAWKGVAQVLVDGKLVHAYPDAGVYGPVLHKGQFGVRLFAGGAMALRMGRFSIHGLKVGIPGGT